MAIILQSYSITQKGDWRNLFKKGPSGKLKLKIEGQISGRIYGSTTIVPNFIKPYPDYIF